MTHDTALDDAPTASARASGPNDSEHVASDRHLLLILPFGIPPHAVPRFWHDSESVRHYSPPPQTWSCALVLGQQDLNAFAQLAAWMDARPDTPITPRYAPVAVTLDRRQARILAPLDDDDVEGCDAATSIAENPAQDIIVRPAQETANLSLRIAEHFIDEDNVDSHLYLRAEQEIPLDQWQALLNADQGLCIGQQSRSPEGDISMGRAHTLHALPEHMRAHQQMCANDPQSPGMPLWAVVPGPRENAWNIARYIAAHMPDLSPNLRSPLKSVHAYVDELMTPIWLAQAAAEARPEGEAQAESGLGL